ncbi:MAG: 4-hydroxy-2-oxoheptanedioate aldolase [Gammaproteobacteria bacterium]|nr:4-hydroxy-2-oxoheptanedioate aldolase [Gammaproteobacteria bacterium]
MRIPTNNFKKALREGQAQIGLWSAFANPYATELVANTGFDWLLIDGEHAPNDPLTVLPQLQAVAPYPAHPIVRPVQGDVALIKRYLDIGVQTLLIPMIETADQAEQMVAATRYPPEGIRGVGSGLARASRWNQVDNYLYDCQSELCVLVQVESAAALHNIAAIAAVDGVDGVFFGPADLSASMGYLGRPNEPEVRAAITNGMEIVKAAGKAVGILAPDRAIAKEYLALGALFVAVGVDTTLLINAARALCGEFKTDASPASSTSGSLY